MQTYNQSRAPIRTLALFEWMTNIMDVKPNAVSYQHIIRACAELNHVESCQKLQETIQNDRTLSSDESGHLRIKMIYMYAKMKEIHRAEQLFEQVKRMKNFSFDAVLFSTMFKSYNMNGQSKKTIELYEKDSSMELDAVTATCILSACSDCQRLDIGEHVHREVNRLHLLEAKDGTPNIRLVTAAMDMYCKCGSLERARELFNRYASSMDRVAYSTLMKTYLTVDQPLQVLALFDQLRSTSITPDAVLFANVIRAGSRLGLPKQAETILHAIPSHVIEKHGQLQENLITMCVQCSRMEDAVRLFHQSKQKTNHSLASLLHGYAIHGDGQRALELFHQLSRTWKFNEQVYQKILHACALTGGLAREARQLYETIPEHCRTKDVASVMERAEPVDDTHNPARMEKLGICWTEIPHDGQTEKFRIHEYHDDDLENYPSLKSELVAMTAELKSAEIDWQSCSHVSSRLGLAKNYLSTSSTTPIQLTTTRPTCPVCHEGMKRLSLTRQRDIVLRDAHRVHHFHNGHCSCRDRF